MSTGRKTKIPGFRLGKSNRVERDPKRLDAAAQRRQTNMRSEEFNRAYALALLKGTLDWMDHVYRRWDHNRREERRKAGELVGS